MRREAYYTGAAADQLGQWSLKCVTGIRETRTNVKSEPTWNLPPGFNSLGATGAQGAGV